MNEITQAPWNYLTLLAIVLAPVWAALPFWVWEWLGDWSYEETTTDWYRDHM